MRNGLILGLVCALLALAVYRGARVIHAQESPPARPAANAPAETAAERAARLKWWSEARFGMFIHWGPVSLRGTEIGWSRGKEVPTAEYDELYRQFNPTKFDARAWVGTARAAGMKYIVLTAKHHDGFCLWNTKLSDYSIAKTPFQRDVVRELADECRKQGLRFCVYYSILDWHHPDYPLGDGPGDAAKQNPDMEKYVAYLRGQLKELVTGYGPLGVLWFDGEWEAPWSYDRGLALYRELRQLQPDLIINNRLGRARAGMSGMDRGEQRVGDYGTPEQELGTFNRDEPWETCMTLGTQWSWKPNDKLKGLGECLRDLIFCAGGDGNLLLNIGPTPTGEIDPRQVHILSAVGNWLRKHGDTIYGTRGGPFRRAHWGASTCKGEMIYLHVLNLPEGGIIELPPLSATIKDCTVLTGGSIEYRQTNDQVWIRLAPRDRQEFDTIVALQLDVSAEALPVVPGVLSRSLAAHAQATASNVFQNAPEYGPEKAVDDDPTTRWATDAGTTQAWLEVDLGKPQSIGGVLLDEPREYQRVLKFEVQVRDGDTWKTIHAGTKIGPELKCDFAPVTARVVRLNILEASDGPTLCEFHVLAPRTP